MIRIADIWSPRKLVADALVLALTFLMAAGISHHFNHAQGDTCGHRDAQAATALPR